jgi:hypothetical protein
MFLKNVLGDEDLLVIDIEDIVRQLDDTLNSQICKKNLVARTPLM